MIVVPAKTKAERKRALRLAVSVLKQGGVIAYPTETVYGLGCDPRNSKALARIFRMKGREKGKPVLLVAGSIRQVRRFVGTIQELPLRRRFIELAKRYWPGPLTMVMPTRHRIMNRKDVAIRVSSDPIAQSITRRFGFPIVSTSANRTGEPAAHSVNMIVRAFGGGGLAPDLVIDAGVLSKRRVSTIIRFSPRGDMEVIRQGSVRINSTQTSTSAPHQLQ